MRPLTTPSENSSGRREPTPGTPLGDVAEGGVPAVHVLGMVAGGVEGAVVGGDDVEHALAHHLPQALVVGLVARCRAAHGLRPLEAGAVHVGGGEGEILRAGLAPDLEAAALGPGDLLGDLGAGDVEDLDRGVDQLGQGDGAVGRLALHHLGPRPGMVFRRGQAGGQELLGQPADGVVVLAMHRHHGALARAAASTRRNWRSSSRAPS